MSKLGKMFKSTVNPKTMFDPRKNALAAEFNPKTHYDRSKKLLFGKGGTQGGFIDQNMADLNREIAIGGYGLSKQIQNIQGGQLQSVADQYANEGSQNLATAADQQVTSDIENRRRALEVANRGGQQQIARGVARRGLSGSASGLFAEQRQQQGLNDQLATLEGTRVNAKSELERQLEDRRLARRASLLSQQASVISGVERPYIQTTEEGTPGKKGLLGAVGGIVGGIYGGPAGAQAGYAAGDVVGEMGRPAPRKRYG